MKLSSLSFVAFTATLLSAAALRAQAPAGNELTKFDAALFAKFDDGDGTLTKEEVGAYPWLRYDTDGDGAISKAEFLLGRLQDRLGAQLAPNTAGSFALLDWTNDGKLSGVELDNGLWLKFDLNGDKIVDKGEYLTGGGTTPTNVPDALPKADATGTWKKHVADILEFEMPGAPEPTKKSAEEVGYRYRLDGGQASYHVSVKVLKSAPADPDAMLVKVCDAVAATIPGGQVVGNEKIALGGNPGRELMIGIPGKLRFRQQVFIAQSRLVIGIVQASGETSVTPADVERFFGSLKFVAADKPVPAPEVATTVTHAKFVKAVADDDDRAIIAMFHPQVAAKINPAMVQMHFDINKTEMGEITDTKSSPPEIKTETIDGIDYVQGKQTVQCANGPMQVTTSIAEGKLVGFQLDSPRITPEIVNQRIYEYLNALLKKGNDSKDFADNFTPECEKFVRTLFDQGSDQALALLDPRVEKGLKERDEVADLTRVRKTFGPVTKLELVTFRVEGTPEKGLDKFKLGFEATRPGKAPATITIFYETEGLQAFIMGYSFDDELTEGVVPPASGVPAPPRTAPPRVAPPSTDDDVPPPPKASAPPKAPAPPIP
ncbi:MAG: hypothetical protein K8U03_15875 [Planctomycetia bacterium]|nr:hypothetical protein [Planctomycetia bacterium]